MVDSSITYKILCPTNSLKVIVVNKNTYINLIMHSLKHSWYLNTKGVDERNQPFDLPTLIFLKLFLKK